MKVGWIDSQLNNSKPLADIVVQTFGEDEVMKKVQLTAEIWQRSLIVDPGEMLFY